MADVKSETADDLSHLPFNALGPYLTSVIFLATVFLSVIR